MIRVLVVATVRLYEEGLAQILRADSRFAVAGTASSVDEALERIRELDLPPDVVLLDVGTAAGVGAVRTIRDALPGAGVVALAVREVEEDVIAWAEAGVAGFVPLDASLSDLMAAVESVARGETLCSPRTAATLLKRVTALAERERGSNGPDPRLTAREREIADLIDQGLSNKEIARSLQIELSTVKNHVHRILEKLQVNRRAEAAALLRGSRGPRV